jgi:hypothetical protein
VVDVNLTVGARESLLFRAKLRHSDVTVEEPTILESNTLSNSIKRRIGTMLDFFKILPELVKPNQ